MRKFVLGCSAALAFITQGAFADHHVKSMEMFACNYAEGKRNLHWCGASSMSWVMTTTSVNLHLH